MSPYATVWGCEVEGEDMLGFHVCDKTLHRNNLRKEGSIQAHTLRGFNPCLLGPIAVSLGEAEHHGGGRGGSCSFRWPDSRNHMGLGQHALEWFVPVTHFIQAGSTFPGLPRAIVVQIYISSVN